MEIVDRDVARFLAEKTEAQRLEIGWGMQRSAVRMITRILRGEHPDHRLLKIAAVFVASGTKLNQRCLMLFLA